MTKQTTRQATQQAATPRPDRTPRQKAEDALAVQGRKVNRIETRLTDARSTVTQLEAELANLKRRRDYLAQDPALAPAEEPERTSEAAGSEDTEQEQA